MNQLIPKIQEVADKISDIEGKRKKLADFLKSVKTDVRLSKPAESFDLNDMRISAVDGGIVKRSLHGFDFVLARGVGVCFSYKNGRVYDVDYFPNKMPTPEFFVMEALSDLEWVHTTSIVRQRVEIKTAIDAVEEFKPDVLLLDGSIIPHYQDRPAKTSKIHGSYQEMTSLYKKLFDTCLSRKVMLAGVVEDSRGTKFCDIVNERILSKVKHASVPELKEILERTRDTNLLYWILHEGERTDVFPYSEKTKEHPVMKDFQEFAGKIFSFYMKTAKFDRPIRIDFLGEKELAEKFASIILSISSHHSGYGLPSVLIEADQVAKLAEDDIDNIYEQVLTQTGSLPSIFRLRRDMRPF
ncbi:MAG: DNA double-strand break repair nuclease NurA [Candidatus Aenigmatarchaeota archaeon]|nr:MAG: DNA double-strand break repair nuclease NurA [Candidatus Aenigmarchaeota archaeon]